MEIKDVAGFMERRGWKKQGSQKQVAQGVNAGIALCPGQAL